MDKLTDLAINITAAVICFIAGLYWRKIIKPWIIQLNYKGMHIDGKWEVIPEKMSCRGYELKVENKIVIYINQLGNKLLGTGTATPINNPNALTYKFVLEGQIKDRLVVIQLTTDDKNNFTQTIYYMQVLGDGSKMEGFSSFLGLIKNEVNSRKITAMKLLQ